MVFLGSEDLQMTNVSKVFECRSFFIRPIVIAHRCLWEFTKTTISLQETVSTVIVL